MTQPAPTTGHALAEEATGGSSGGKAEKGSGGESTGTVIVAGAVNLAIAVAKLVGGLISHSSAMLSEAAHSLADTVTEVLLFVALKRGNRAADARHPFGYGRETYFWAFIASLCTFGVGAGFSIYQGVTTILGGEEQGSPTISYIVLAVSFVLEGGSLVKAVRQVRGEAKEHGTTSRRYLQHTTDTTIKAVTFEDSAALVGLVLAALGLFLEQMTGDPVWDGIAAILIGLLLILVAGVLAQANVSLLIGQSLPGTTQQELKDELAGMDLVDDVPFLLTSVIGPGQVIVSAKVDFADSATVADIERAADEAERRLVARHPGVRYVFLDPTPGNGKARFRAPEAGELE
ncbi:cation diffusion facilitator family transporter [Modestobacter sp. DSM 44400]|uniref:cation diffusion facilitator family transporter n=1 Tax=Modestobacter sp. DSM 44400 TaxID=1550230 RepID=UPI00089B64A2|nr:cation diffusion facilitator family transporter [Modestobacter sp. DSM 44400]SDY46117.1 cation diffusion facilitator family transporter [Modestobacter sp. DSM 44400]